MVTYGDQRLSIVVQRNVKVSCVVDEENWVIKNVFSYQVHFTWEGMHGNYR